VLQARHIFTRTRTIAMFYLKCKIIRTCDSFHYLMTINRLLLVVVTAVVVMSMGQWGDGGGDGGDGGGNGDCSSKKCAP